jgi:hypothetical protein
MISDSILGELFIFLLHDVSGLAVVSVLLQRFLMLDTDGFLDLITTFLSEFYRLCEPIHLCK